MLKKTQQTSRNQEILTPHPYTYTFAQLYAYLTTPSCQLGNHYHIAPHLGVQDPLGALHGK